MSTKPADPFTILLNNVRLSYAQLFTAKAMQNADGSLGKLKFQATLLLDKKVHAADIVKIEALIQRACLDKFGKANVKLKNVCLRDGEEKEDTEGYGPEIMFVPASNETRPPVVDRDGVTPLVEQDGRIFSGCYVNACIRLYAYDHPKGGKGVSASLQAVQFYKDGPAFGAGRVKPEDVFTAVSGDVNEY